MVDVYLHRFRDGAFISRSFLSLLGEEEIKRCRMLKREEDRHRFVISRALLRYSLSQFSGVAPRKWGFRREGSGRWRITGPETTLRFGLSHTRNVVGVAVSRGHELGLDLEALSEPFPYRSISAALSEAELEGLERLTEERRWKEEIRLWTLKEAFAKYTGLGAEIDFPSVLAGNGEGGDGSWSEEILVDDEPFQLSLVVEGPNQGGMNVRFVESLELERSLEAPWA